MIEIPELEIPATLEEVRSQSITISTEAVQGDRLIRAFTGRLSRFAKTVTEYMKEAFAKRATIKADWNLMKLRTLVTQNPYTSVGEINVAKPGGMVGDYANAIKVLTKALDLVQDYNASTQAPFRQWLGRLLGTPDELKSIRDLKAASGAALFDISAVRRDVANTFSGNSTEDVPFKAVFRSNNDFIDVLLKAQDLSERVNQLDIVKMSREQDDMNELMETLADRIENDRANYPVSGQTLKFLAEGYLNVAEQGELIGLIHFHTAAVCGALKDVEKKLHSKF